MDDVISEFPEVPDTWVCSGCGVEKPLDADHFYRSAVRRTGWDVRCKACERERRRVEHQIRKRTDPTYMEKRRASDARHREKNRQLNAARRAAEEQTDA